MESFWYNDAAFMQQSCFKHFYMAFGGKASNTTPAPHVQANLPSKENRSMKTSQVKFNYVCSCKIEQQLTVAEYLNDKFTFRKLPPKLKMKENKFNSILYNVQNLKASYNPASTGTLSHYSFTSLAVQPMSYPFLFKKV